MSEAHISAENLSEEQRTVVVYGAYGHTGRFVVAELRERGFAPVLAGRDERKLKELAAESGDGLPVRAAAVDEPEALDRALAGAAAVINCAGPFATTAAPLVEAALRAGIPYVDVAAEIEANADTFARFDEPARAAGTVVLPAMAFYGGLGDLLVTAAMGEWTEADEVRVAYGLDSWHPTAGTRAAGAASRERRGGRRLVFTDGRLQHRDGTPPTREWGFPEPLGRRAVIDEFTMADVVTVPSHLAVREVRTLMTVEAAGDLATADTPPPVPDPADPAGRSAQRFLVDVRVRAGGQERRAVASGRDIYAVTAPLAVEAVARLLTDPESGRPTAGVHAAGALFDAPDFLHALAPHLTVRFEAGSVDAP
ncbi:saccharopine dehydrogenase family protein [Streptomyces sp. NPDC014779]|uniref:saccharopine dehydrogenase family protein n=1 Tax=Streptomyces sp. NPDC014779 TaxID=3364911 RepID=UPI00370259CB